jgi:hypothetical protein
MLKKYKSTQAGNLSLLQQIIEDLSPGRYQKALHWLNCPLHNRREDVRQLLKFRWKNKGTDHDYPSEFRAIYGPEVYRAAKHRQLEHQLLKRLESFLAWEVYSQNTYTQDGHLLTAYRERGLRDHLSTRLRRYRPGSFAGLDRYAFEYQHARTAYDAELAGDRGGRADYAAAEQHLERYVLGLKLRQATVSLAHQRLHKTGRPDQIPRLEEVLTAAEQVPFREEPGIYLFYLAAKIQRASLQEAEPYFHQLVSGLEEKGQFFPPDDQRNLLVLAINYGLRRANSGWEAAVPITFNLYRLGLSREIIYQNGQLSLFSFNNILALAIRLHEIAWATHFLESQQQFLAPPGREEVVALGSARLALANGEDGEALRHLQQADFRDFIHHLTARVLQLKIYFRQDSYMLLQSHISSTRKLLTRKKKGSYHLENYRNIFMLAHAVLRLVPGDQAHRAQLRTRVLATEPCTEKPWLLSLIDGN